MHWKSLVIGLLLGSLIVLLVGAIEDQYQCSAVMDDQGWVIVVRCNVRTGELQATKFGNLQITTDSWCDPRRWP